MLTGYRLLVNGYCALIIGATICYSFDVVGPTDVDILLGEDATLQCVITDCAGFVGKWSKVDEDDDIFTLISSGGYIGTGHDSTKHSDWSVDTTGINHYDLHIPNVYINDEGCYFCGIGNADSNSMSNTCGNLRVIVPLSSRPVLTNFNHGDTATVTRNVMTTFICTTSGTNPAATIEWYIDSTRITNGITTSDRQSNGLYDTTSTLQYIPVWNSDQDKDIKCEAYVFTTHTHYSTYVTLDVLVPSSSPVIDGYTHNDDITVNAGMSSTLTCSATAKPASTIEWYIGNTLQSTTMTSPTPNSEDSELFDVSSTFTFTPQWSNHLQYVKCKADNDAIGNAVVTRVKLDVNVAVNTIIISDDANTGGYTTGDNVIVTDGLSHILKCETIGSKPAASNIDWDTDSITVEQSSKSDSPNSGDSRLFDTTSTIEFTPLWSYHSKTITCEGSNSANIQPVITNIKLDVQVSPFSVIISEESSGYVIVTFGHMTTLTCVAMAARPASDIQWTVDNDNPNDDEIISDNTQDSDLKDTTSTMTFTPTYLDHQNTTLTCKATNDATIAKGQPVIKELILDVWVSPDSLYFDGYPDNSNVTMASGESFHITCITTKAHPAASILWYIDDDIITSNVNSRILWDSDGRKDTVSELSLTPNREDFGKKIKCESTHDVQNNPQTIIFNMIVQYLPTAVSDNVYYCKVGDSVSMVLSVDAYPLPVTFGAWMKDDLVLDNSENTQSTSTVTITLVNHNHFGIYNVRATNDVGWVILHVELLQSDTPAVPVGINIIDRYYDSLTLQILPGSLGGDPENVLYFVEYRSPLDTVFVPWPSDGMGTRNMTVYLLQLEPSTAYEIRAKAKNNNGMGEFSSIQLFYTYFTPTVTIDAGTNTLGWSRHENIKYQCVKIEKKDADGKLVVVQECIDRDILMYKVDDTRLAYIVTYCEINGKCENRRFEPNSLSQEPVCKTSNIGIISGILVTMLICSGVVIVVLLVLYKRANKDGTKQHSEDDRSYTTVSPVTGKMEDTYETPMAMQIRTHGEDNNYMSLSPDTREVDSTYQMPVGVKEKT